MSEVPEGCRLPDFCPQLADCEKFRTLPLTRRHALLGIIGHFLILNESMVDDCVTKKGQGCIAGSDLVTRLIIDDSVEYVNSGLERIRLQQAHA